MLKEWEATSIDKGTVKQGIKLLYEFIYNGDKVIKDVTASCGCTAAKSDGNKIKATLSTSVPNHLNEVQYKKKITVTFADGSSNELFLLAKVIR